MEALKALDGYILRGSPIRVTVANHQHGLERNKKKFRHTIPSSASKPTPPFPSPIPSSDSSTHPLENDKHSYDSLFKLNIKNNYHIRRNNIKLSSIMKVTIPPKTQRRVKVSVSNHYESTNTYNNYNGHIFVSSGLYPALQVQDGQYFVKNNLMNICIRNPHRSRKMHVSLHQPIRGAIVHTTAFIERFLLENFHHPHTDIDILLTGWHTLVKSMTHRPRLKEIPLPVTSATRNEQSQETDSSTSRE